MAGRVIEPVFLCYGGTVRNQDRTVFAPRDPVFPSISRHLFRGDAFCHARYFKERWDAWYRLVSGENFAPASYEITLTGEFKDVMTPAKEVSKR
jgi:hypothetical protein